ncbi:MAG: neuraminidase-like domain-containing protein [Trebonia sp.]
MLPRIPPVDDGEAARLAGLLRAETGLIAAGPAREAALRFLGNSPDFDLRQTKISGYLTRNADKAFPGVEPGPRADVAAQLRRVQRALRLGGDAGTAAALLRRGLDSAHKIANTPRRGFLAEHAAALGGTGPAAQVYDRAQWVNGRSLLIYVGLNDARNGVTPRAIGGTGHAAAMAQLEAGLIRQVPDYAELFGSMDLCECEDCRSVLSPAAYLVDLLQFLAKSTPENAAGQTPLDVLLTRRPDLATIELSCENTNTALPYIDLVNEILEGWIVNNGQPPAIANNTGDESSAELDANPQYTLFPAYVTLGTQPYPFTLPFSQPVTEARAYLRNLGSSRQEILTVFQPAPSAASASAADAESLGLTREQFQLLAGQDFDANAGFTPPPPYSLYGYDSATTASGVSWTADVAAVPAFLSRTGISYQDLVDLVSTRLINPGVPQGADGDLFARLPLDYPALTTLVQQQFATTDQGVLDALAAAGITMAELQAWCGRNYGAIAAVLVLDNPGGDCDLATTLLTHLGDTGASLPASTVTAGELTSAQALIRLRNYLGWAFSDLDRAMSARGTAGVTASLITDLARISQLAGGLAGASVQVLLALWAPLDAWGTGSLYRQLFLSPATLPIDTAFQPGPDGSVLTDTAAHIADHVPALLAALGVTGTDLGLIRADAGLDADDAPLSLASVSALYQYAALARLLVVGVADLITLRTLAGPSLDPFSSPAAAVAFTDMVRVVQASGFSPVLLNYLLRHVSSPPTSPAPQQATLLTLASGLRQGLAAIAAQTSATADPTGTVTHATLTQLISADVADRATAMINGTAVYAAPLAVLPPAIAAVSNGAVTGINPAAVPAVASAKISYDPASGTLSFTGAMAASERNALLGAVPDAGFQAAVNGLASQPLAFITGALGGVLDPVQAASTLVTAMPSLDPALRPVLLDASGAVVTDQAQAASTVIAAKRAFVLASALPYLGRQLSHALARQTAADALGLDPAAATLLTETTLTSPADQAQPLSADLLALGTPGLTAQYFSTPGLDDPGSAGAGQVPPPVTITVPTVGPADAVPDAAAPGTVPGITIPPGTQSARWRAWLLPQVSGDYTFTVACPGTVALWVGDDAAPGGLTLTKDQVTGALASGPVTLTAGSLTSLRLEVRSLPQAQSAGTAAELSWQCQTVAKAVVPSVSLMPTGILDNFTLAWTRLQKAALLSAAFAFTPAELGYLTAHPADFGGLDLNALPLTRDPAAAAQTDQAAVPLFAWWQRLQAYVTLRAALPGGQVTLTDVFGAATLTDAQQLLAQATGWDPGLLGDLISGFGLAAAAGNPLASETWPAALRRCVDVATRTGASAAQLFSWASYDLAIADLKPVAEDIKKTARARYDPAGWLSVAKPLSDTLRTAQRDALVSYIAQALGLSDQDQLLEVFLIDAEMGACMETSRISQAIGSVQLFVQRCLMNLEEDVSPSAIDAAAWRQWRSQYSIWAADRLTFLSPEDYLVPSLRDDITPFFADFQSAVIQNQVTSDNAEAAFLAYLEDLYQVARLDIRGLYWQDTDPDTGEMVDTLHVFGRTFHKPRQYFYRRQLNASTTPQWTAWEQVPIDIAGDHLVPVVWNRRLRLIWPMFTEQSVPQSSGTVSYNSSTGTATSTDGTMKYWQVTLAWSDYVQGTWQPKQVSDQFLLSRVGVYGEATFGLEPAQSLHLFKARTDGDDLVVDMLVATEGQQPMLFGEFRFTAFGTAITVGYTADQSAWPDDITPSPNQDPGDPVAAANEVTPGYTNAYFNGIDQAGAPSGSQVLDLPAWAADATGGAAPYWSRLLSATPTPFDLRFPQQYWQLMPGPFCYQDRDRTFFATGGVSRYLGYLTQFATHRHPYVPELLKALARQQGQAGTGGVSGLLTIANQTLGSPYLGLPWTRAESLPDAVTGPAAMVAGDYGTAPDYDFEAVTLEGTSLVHYYRSNAQPGTPWLKNPNTVSTAAAGPASMIQSDYTVNGHRQLEVIVQETGGALTHYAGQAAAAVPGQNRPAVTWQKSGETLPSGGVGPSSLIQSGPASPNGHLRFDLVILQGTNLVHCWWDGPGTTWQVGETITSQAAAPGALVGDAVGYGPLTVVVPESPAAGTGPPWQLRQYYVDSSGAWQQGGVITTAAAGPACLIQSDIADGWVPNYEMVVPEGGSGPPWNLVHYWLDNSALPFTAGISAWQAAQIVSSQATGPGCLIQSGYGKDAGTANGDFEVLSAEGTSLVHYAHGNGNHVQWASLYGPNAYQVTVNGPEQGMVFSPYPVENIDFTPTGAYYVYNMELFLYAPVLIATTLSQNQQFADADAWFRYVLDPTDDSANELAPQRYWKVLPLKTTPAQSVTSLMTALDLGDPNVAAQVTDWQAHPFEPFRIARLRVTAFQRWIFMRYLDNLIAWGDQLFAQNTRESINQATQLYVYASDLLGPRPEQVPPRTAAPTATYAQLQSRLDAFSNAMELLENEFPFAAQIPSPGPDADTAGLLGLSQTLFFGIPQNTAMLGYWDTVADRLFKVRHCMNLQGVVEQLPLFQPIGNPALLVQAAAAGVDLGSVLTDVNTAPPNYRFSYLLGKALELCADCRAFGTELLAALEKGDAEGLALLRATQETTILTMMQSVKQDHVTELTDAVSALQASRDTTWGRYAYYQTLLGATSGAAPPPGTAIADLTVPTEPATTDGGMQLLPEEQSELDASHDARDLQTEVGITETLAGLMHALPDFSGNVQPFGIGLSVVFGGTSLGLWTAATARALQTVASKRSYDASHAARMAGYFRRQQEWTLQSNLASGEFMRIDNEIAAANLRVGIAQQELAVHVRQMADAQKIQDTLTGKYTSQQLYQWMAGQASGLYFQLYQMAYGAAKQAERALDAELGVTGTSYIQFGYWDSLRKGLLSGERLLTGLRQLEQAYVTQNKREYEITRGISLLTYAPLALIALKEAGQCVVEFPEALFDMDYPGHYFRRLKSVALTIPCVAGPYTSVNCTLTLLAHKIRTDPDSSGDYAERPNNDGRFQYTYAATQSIATSHAQNDSGLFELNFRDERYLPFETAGAVSRWLVSMPPQCNAFDFSTITDVIVRLSYTARDGGDLLRQKALAAATLPPGPSQAAPGQLGALPGQQDLGRLFSAKHEFPTEWYGLLHPADAAASYAQLPMQLTTDRFPFQFRGRTVSVTGFDLYLTFKSPGEPGISTFDLYLTEPAGPPPPPGTPPAPPADPSAGKVTLTQDPLLGNALHGTVTSSGAASTIPNYWWLSANATGTASNITSLASQIDDIIVICHYSVT